MLQGKGLRNKWSVLVTKACLFLTDTGNDGSACLSARWDEKTKFNRSKTHKESAARHLISDASTTKGKRLAAKLRILDAADLLQPRVLFQSLFRPKRVFSSCPRVFAVSHNSRKVLKKTPWFSRPPNLYQTCLSCILWHVVLFIAIVVTVVLVDVTLAIVVVCLRFVVGAAVAAVAAAAVVHG